MAELNQMTATGAGGLLASRPWVVPVLVGGIIGLALLLLLVALLRRRRPAGARCRQCGRVVLASWAACRFCGAALRDLRAELEVVSGPLLGQTIGLDRDVTTIGAVSGNTVVLADNGVSRKHLGIRRSNGEYELADLGSTNGVYVNGERVARRKLAVGDVIRVGASEMVFRV